MPLGGAGSGYGVASLAGSAGNVSLLLFQAPSPGGQVTPAEARPPLSGCPVLVLGSGRLGCFGRPHPVGLRFLN